MNKTWGIIGLGWLGSSLAQHLQNLGVKHWGTTTKNFDWKVNDFPKTFCDVLFLNTPPLVEISPQSFVNKISNNTNQQVIFISSIGVYGPVTGLITETTPPQPKSPNGIWLSEVEQLLLKKFKDQLTIIRAGGLIGGERHPVHSLSKNKSRIVEDSPINLIHREDLIELIFAISKLEKRPSIINAVTPYHPSKKDYYSLWAKKLNLEPMQFSKEINEGRIISSEVLHLIYPNWRHPKLDTL